MCSPTVKEDWVAVKEFPHVKGDREANDDCSNAVQCLKFDVIWKDNTRTIEVRANQNGHDHEKTELRAHEMEQEINQNEEDELRDQNGNYGYCSEFSIEKITKIHAQVALMFPEMEHLLPNLPSEPRGNLIFLSAHTNTIF